MKKKINRRDYTVIGMYYHSGQVCADFVRQAKDGPEAMRRAALMREGRPWKRDKGEACMGGDTDAEVYSLIVAVADVDGKGPDLSFAGDGVVDTTDYININK